MRAVAPIPRAGPGPGPGRTSHRGIFRARWSCAVAAVRGRGGWARRGGERRGRIHVPAGGMRARGAGFDRPRPPGQCLHVYSSSLGALCAADPQTLHGQTVGRPGGGLAGLPASRPGGRLTRRLAYRRLAGCQARQRARQPAGGQQDERASGRASERAGQVGCWTASWLASWPRKAAIRPAGRPSG